MGIEEEGGCFYSSKRWFLLCFTLHYIAFRVAFLWVLDGINTIANRSLDANWFLWGLFCASIGTGRNS